MARNRVSHEQRMEGRFLTPPAVVRKVHEYLDTLLPGWRTMNIYDPCAGTGNLEVGIGSSRLWLSTLLDSDVEELKRRKIAPETQCFKMNYLADEGLLDALTCPALPDIGLVIMNPPFGTSGGSANSKAIKKKTGISKTGLAASHRDVGMSELCTQFMFRVHRDHPGAYVCLLSKGAYLTSPGLRKNLNNFWPYRMLGGFMFPGSLFEGVSGRWPVLTTIWAPSTKFDSSAPVDVYTKRHFEGKPRSSVVAKPKFFKCPDQPLSAWVARPSNTEIAVPLKNPIQVTTGQARCTSLPKCGIGYLSSIGADVQKNSIVYALSSAVGHGNGFSIIPSNFAKSIMMWAVRRLISDRETNHDDRYSIPHPGRHEEKTEQKRFECPDQPLIEWIARPGSTELSLPLKNPIQVTTGKMTATSLPRAAMGYLVNKGPNVQNNTGTCCFSSVNGGGRGLPIIPSNFAKSIMMWAVRKLITDTWINDSDQYSIPSQKGTNNE